VTRTRSTRSHWTLALAIVLLNRPGLLQAADQAHSAGHVTQYDFATQGDLFLSHLVAPMTAGDVEVWSKTLLGGYLDSSGTGSHSSSTPRPWPTS
jgi:hypothetical protein